MHNTIRQMYRGRVGENKRKRRGHKKVIARVATGWLVAGERGFAGGPRGREKLLGWGEVQALAQVGRLGKEWERHFVKGFGWRALQRRSRRSVAIESGEKEQTGTLTEDLFDRRPQSHANATGPMRSSQSQMDKCGRQSDEGNKWHAHVEVSQSQGCQALRRPRQLALGSLLGDGSDKNAKYERADSVARGKTRLAAKDAAFQKTV